MPLSVPRDTESRLRPLGSVRATAHSARVTNSEMLAKVDGAIDAILTGSQSMTVLGRTYTRANLDELWAMRKELTSAVTAEARGGSTVRLVVPA